MNRPQLSQEEIERQMAEYEERLRTYLFERAEEGDFSREYEVHADSHPDSVTMVGRAYNRVRSQLFLDRARFPPARA